MKSKSPHIKTNQLLLALAPLLLCGGLAMAAPVGSAFHYNGLLHDNGAPANGAFDLQFRLFDAPAAGAPVGPVQTLEDVAVNKGLFTVPLDFGAAVFDGSARFLEIGVRPGADTGSFNTLPQRQPVLPTPEAVHAAKADTANNVPSGSIGSSQLANGAVVRSLNGLKDTVLLEAGANVTLTPISGNKLQISATDSSDGVWTRSGPNISYNGGLVGIGTASPISELHIRSGSDTFITLQKPSGSDLSGIDFVTGGAHRWRVFTADDGTDDLRIISVGSPGESDANPRILLPHGNNKNILLGLSGGDVGIGTANPQSRLHVVGNVHLSGGGQYITCDDRMHIQSAENLYLNPAVGSGPVYVGGAGGSSVDLIVTGTTTTKVLTITGADFSERFDIAEADGAHEPGKLVCIDPTNPGKLVLSTKSHDRTVAGIISGAGGVNPGIYMGQPGTLADGKHPVALTGRVYAWADTSAGPIRPGDLLTTSDTPGHAMKVTDHSAAQGAIIGKAMTPLAEGKGLVLVLVSLQ